MPNLLAGKLFDEAGEPLYVTGTSKGRRRYRYYVSRRLVTAPAKQTKIGWRLPAPEIERTVVAAAQILEDRAALGTFLHEAADMPAHSLAGALEALDDCRIKLQAESASAPAAGPLIVRVELGEHALQLTLNLAVLPRRGYEGFLRPSAASRARRSPGARAPALGESEPNLDRTTPTTVSTIEGRTPEREQLIDYSYRTSESCACCLFLQRRHVVKLGYFDFNPDYSMRPDDLGRACEERGYDSLWLGEHINIPTSRRTPYPGGGELPKLYSHMRDPFISLMAAGAVTKNLKLATGICLMTERDPITTAKEVATLDSLSNGRVIFGIGAGWNAEEMENHGTPFNRRWKVLRERVQAIKKLWTEDEPSFHGEFVNFEPLWSYPKPIQKPHPPVIMGSIQSRGLQRIVDYCDGWCPVDMAIEDFQRVLAELSERCEKAGRDPRSLSISIFATGDPAESKLQRYRELGVERVVLGVLREDVDVKEKVLPFLDRYARLIPKLA